MILFHRLGTLALATLLLSACQSTTLDNSHWALQSIDGHPVVPHSKASLSFLPEGRVAGSASCNRYFGQFTQSESLLKLFMVGSTKMWCHSDNNDVMAQENRFLQALSAAQRVSWEGEHLLIHVSDSAEPLRFVAVKP